MSRNPYREPYPGLIGEARNLLRSLWVMNHPDFRTLGLDLNEETVLREHAIDFASIFGATAWNRLTDDQLRLYVACLKIEIACYELDVMERFGTLTY